PYSILVAEMMKCQRAKRDVVYIDRAPFENVGFPVGNLRIVGAQLSRDFQCGRLPIQRIDFYFRADTSRIIDNQSRDIARSRRHIKNAKFIGRSNPPANKPQYKPITTEPAIQLPDTL